jgi:hypothetical protein
MAAAVEREPECLAEAARRKCVSVGSAPAEVGRLFLPLARGHWPDVLPPARQPHTCGHALPDPRRSNSAVKYADQPSDHIEQPHRHATARAPWHEVGTWPPERLRGNRCCVLSSGHTARCGSRSADTDVKCRAPTLPRRPLCKSSRIASTIYGTNIITGENARERVALHTGKW